MRNPPRIGCVGYLNAKPLIYGWQGEVRFDHPSRLCQMLVGGEVDLALVSSWEYLRNPIYSIVDGISIASDGPVYSVYLAYRKGLENLREIVVDPASETSVNLLRCLLGERGLAVPFVRQGELNPHRGQLLIGDQAIQFREGASDEIQFLDLGAAWKELAGLPFVYALWLIRPDYVEKEEVAIRLRSLAGKNLDQLDQIIASQPEQIRDFAEFYFRNCLCFSFSDREKKGFLQFAQLCVRQNLLPTVPTLTGLV